MKAHGKYLVLPALFFQALAIILSCISLVTMIVAAFIPGSKAPLYYMDLKIPQLALIFAVLGGGLIIYTAIEMLFGRDVPKMPRLTIHHPSHVQGGGHQKSLDKSTRSDHKRAA